MSVPERSLGALDDFDRPITEASVRLFAGAMLDVIRDELEVLGAEEDVSDTGECKLKPNSSSRISSDLVKN